MSTSAVPAIIDALVAQATAALSTVKVYDGVGISEDPGDFLMVGVEDPDSPNPASSADASQRWAHVGHVDRDEEGDVTCAALSWNGNANQKQARDGAYAITTALENLLRTDPTLGIGPLVRAEFGGSTQLTQAQDGNGAMALLVFRIHFEARI